MSEKSMQKVVSIEANKEDLFSNLDNIRVRQDFDDQVGTQKELIRVPIIKPNHHEWVRVHKNEEFHVEAELIENKADKEIYLVHPRLHGIVSHEAVRTKLYYAITRQNDVFLWPARMVDQNGNLDTWSKSRHKAAAKAKEKWVRVISNHKIKAYDVLVPRDEFDEPIWPDHSIEEIYRVAFEERVIDDLQHPFLKMLRGEK